MTLNEQIKALLARRLKHVESMTLLSTKAATDGEGRNFTPDEAKEFDTAETAIKELDAQIARLKSLEATEAAGAVAAADPASPARAAPVATPGVEVRAFKPFKGQGFVRLAMAIANTKGNTGMAASYADRWKDQTPEVGIILRAMAQTGELPADVLRAAVAAGTTANATWAGPLVYATNLASEFIEMLRPATILGKLPLRPVPFNVSIPRQTNGVAVGWVGEGLSKPVGKLDFDRITIPWAKVAVIAVITQELARLSDPSAEMLVRDDLIQAIAGYLDQQFIDPAVAAVAGTRPGSITNGVTPVVASGVTVAAVNTDLTACLKALANANMPFISPRWIMTAAARITLANMRTVQDQYAFPEVQNLMLKGYPIIESNNVPTDVAATPDDSIIVLADCSQIFHAEDPAVDIVSSTEASLQMDSAPATPATPLVSMFQQNLLAIKAEQYQYWAKRHAGCVTYLDNFVVG